MLVDVVALPADLQRSHLVGRTVVVFDVLRATTTMTAALSAGVTEIRVFDDLATTRAAAQGFSGAKLLVGERHCLRPEGFDLGNSPEPLLDRTHAGKTIFMCTTNGTRAILAAARAERVLVGAIVNAAAVARVLKRDGRDVTLLCAGTDGQPATEDLVGADAVLAALGDYASGNDAVAQARRAFDGGRNNLQSLLVSTTGGRNVIRAGLPDDVSFASKLDALPAVGEAFVGIVKLAR